MAQSVTVGNGGNKNVPTIYVGNSGNKVVTEGWVGTGSGNKQFFSGLTATDDGPATSAVDGLRAPNVGDITVTGSDGKTPYSIAWVRLSGSTVPVISSASSFSVHWTVPSNPAGYSATWQYTVTDGHSIQAVGTVAIDFQSSA